MKPFQNARWITRQDNPIEKELLFFKDKPNIVFTKEFEWTKENEVKLYICGLGYYTAYLNGQRLGDTYLNSDVTNYDKTVYYDSYDLSTYVKLGKNTLTVELANGWYNPAPINILGKYNVRKQLAIGKPCLIADIQIGDKHIYSDNSWQASFGRFIQNDIYIGEVYTDKEWMDLESAKTVAIPGPAGKLTPSFIPKIKRHALFEPVNIEKQGNGWFVDFGQIISGHIALQIKADYFGEIKIQYSEDITADKQLDFQSTISGRYGLYEESKGISPDKLIVQEDKIIKTKASMLAYENQYTYHSFRYAFITADTEEFPIFDLVAYRVHTDVKQLSHFESSSDILNQLWQAGLNTRFHNIHSYFEDCSRERLGYGGDTVGLLQAHLITIDAHQLFKKVLLDFVNDQRLDGGVTQTAPYIGIMTNGTSNGSGSLGWQLVLPTLAKSLIEDYQDIDFVIAQQSYLERHLEYLLGFDYDYVKYCCLGDWGSIDEIVEGYMIKSPDQEFCSAVMYLLSLQAYATLAQKVTGLSDYQDRVENRISTIKQAIQDEFFNLETNRFASGSASSMMFALHSGLVNDEEKWYADLVEMIKGRDGIFPFGIFGMSWAYEEMAMRGDNSLIYDWLTRTSTPSYYDMLKSGNLTLAEHFSGEETFAGSKNHAMFSSYSTWLVREVLGIKLLGNRIIIAPDETLPLEWTSGWFEFPEGKVSVHKSQKTLEITCPKLLKNIIYYEFQGTVIVKEID